MQSNDTPSEPNIRQKELRLDNKSDENDDNMHVLHRQPSTVFQDYAIPETSNVQSPQDYVNISRRNELHVPNVSPFFTPMSHSSSFALTFTRFPLPLDTNAFPSSRNFVPAYSNIIPQSNQSLIPDARLTFQYDAFMQPYIPREAPRLNTFLLPFRPSTSSVDMPNLSREYSTFSNNSLPVIGNMLLSRQNQSVTNIIPELNDYHPTHSRFASPTSHFGIQIRNVEMLFPNNVPPSNSLTFHSNSPPSRQILPSSRNVLQPLEQIVLPENQLSSPSLQQARSEYSYAYISNKRCSSKQPNTQETIDIGKKSYVCGYCGKAFSNKNELKIHTFKKPYVCKECGEKFCRIDSLKEHKLVHTGENTYVCENCGKIFNRLSSLNYHKLVHSGEKPSTSSGAVPNLSREYSTLVTILYQLPEICCIFVKIISR